MPIIPCPGFRAAGMVAGIKKNGRKDLGLIACDGPASVAGLFTRNRVQAAPVILDRERVSNGVCRALLGTSGNAKCCPGDDTYLVLQSVHDHSRRHDALSASAAMLCQPRASSLIWINNPGFHASTYVYRRGPLR